MPCLNRNTASKHSEKNPKVKGQKLTKKSLKNKARYTWWSLKKPLKKGSTKQKRKVKVNNDRQFGRQIYEVNAVRDIRFTPIKRRYVNLHLLY